MWLVVIVSVILENLSILTGFPFGHYYYADNLGPKLALAPLFIGSSYVAFGYLAWVLSTIIVGEVRLRLNRTAASHREILAAVLLCE